MTYEGLYLDDLDVNVDEFESIYAKYRDAALASPGEWVVVMMGSIHDLSYDRARNVAGAAAGNQDRKTKSKYGNGIEAKVRTTRDGMRYSMIRYLEKP